MEELDADSAAALLRQNVNNRLLDSATVDRYAAAMRRGEWRLSHQGIAVDSGGNLLDGQHRLAAIVKSKMSVKMLVVRGVERSTFSVVDTGKKRSATDSLRLSGVADANHTAAALRYIGLYDELPANAAWSGARARMTNDQVLALHKLHPGVGDCVRRARSVAAAIGIISSACAAAIYITERGSGESADSEEWFRGIVTGARLEVGDSRLALRAFFMNSRAQGHRRPRSEARDHIALYIKAWNNWLRGEKRQMLAFRRGEVMPKPIVL
ncbi:hypothetical protein [Kutzneria chonburiensis]|uniref:ParB/Sulfiredoxin domain-containing protein n=1 Tax=Kutzneria chonburiensis TaxID=1483604 RepID=A0ABV6N485_9PSEU|nr:hypothetical protein [Kutzneria chonburiensis]